LKLGRIRDQERRRKSKRTAEQEIGKEGINQGAMEEGENMEQKKIKKDSGGVTYMRAKKETNRKERRKKLKNRRRMKRTRNEKEIRQNKRQKRKRKKKNVRERRNRKKEVHVITGKGNPEWCHLQRTERKEKMSKRDKYVHR